MSYSISDEVFTDQNSADAWISTLLELKFGYEYKRFKDLSFDKKKELYKSAKRKWKKAHMAPSTNG